MTDVIRRLYPEVTTNRWHRLGARLDLRRRSATAASAVRTKEERRGEQECTRSVTIRRSMSSSITLSRFLRPGAAIGRGAQSRAYTCVRKRSRLYARARVKSRSMVAATMLSLSSLLLYCDLCPSLLPFSLFLFFDRRRGLRKLSERGFFSPRQRSAQSVPAVK